ncbi:hypothetical protein GCM10010435_23080 [Winogradskya consettensis]|uniref:LD-carboxypeptidase C-terminal domain-containing protein n=1 Tax=Winogradskya consettensis TaxID=113560 RepID=A0A919W072_9ACTN|nr:hypothetical protein [Actinoplanes consettensis]GIM75328.1 hypothetical protein Aco04nite_44790 [Actinoplanes consettensis]
MAVDLFGQKTYVADSMQFMLEYACRFSDSGAWYLMPRFRGEDADETHLNVPVLMDLPFGHTEPSVTVPLGASGEVRTDPVTVTAFIDR